MKTLIENYRGFEIFFDTDNENFYSVSDKYDRQETKKSYASAKKSIDDYIKYNTEFTPFFVEKHGSVFNEAKTLRIVGLRKDNRFIAEDMEGMKGQLSEYDEQSYFLPNDENEPIKNVIENLTKQIENLNKLRSAEENKLIKVSLKDVKDKYKI